MIDIAIIGGGVAGLTAGMYAKRAGLDAKLYEKMFPGGQAVNIHTVENYPGIKGSVTGTELSMAFMEQAESFGLEIRYDEITDIDFSGKYKVIKTENETIEAKAVIIATGANPRKLGLESEEKMAGKGVSYCATCDGALYKDKKVAVIGGGDTAVEDALFLSQTAEHVYIVHRRDELRATKIISDALLNNPKITPVWDSVVEEITGEEKVEGIIVKNKKTDSKTLLDVEGVFVAIGITPSSAMFKDKLLLNESGFIITDETCRTSVAGVYAAGDIRQKVLWQLVTAASDGAVATVSANKYIIENAL